MVRPTRRLSVTLSSFVCQNHLTKFNGGPVRSVLSRLEFQSSVFIYKKVISINKKSNLNFIHYFFFEQYIRAFYACF